MAHLTQDQIWSILEATNEKGEKIHQDVLTPLAKQEDSFFKRCQCPSCGSCTVEPFVNPSQPFSSGSPLPNRLMRCVLCKTEFSPYTNVIVRAPSSASS